ncbi:hypothetical protein [Cyclobacterium xiamenense]|uniref:hypothetical protein n=1 Tax=Cyclobacterium xiamenense TaxID=1297121 RepID=UPI0035CEFB45
MQHVRTLQTLIFLSASVCFYSCDNDPLEVSEPELSFSERESPYFRVIGWDDTGQVFEVSPSEEEKEALDLAPVLLESNNYISSSMRYLVSVERADGKVRILDSGMEDHGDHGHAYPARWLNHTFEAPLPTHFSSTNGQIIIFNDGDGSILWIREASLANPTNAATMIMPENMTAHHGAATWLKSNLLAVSFKVAGVPGPLPQQVKLMNEDGEIVHENPDLQVGGIHGDASNGDYALFGSTDGVVVADSQGSISLLPNDASLNSESGNWLGTIKGNDRLQVFYGRSRNKGVYRIDPQAKSMVAVYEGADIQEFAINPSGKFLLIQTTDGKLLVYDAPTGLLLVEQASISAEAFGMVASEELLYILPSEASTVQVFDLERMHPLGELAGSRPLAKAFGLGF